MSGINTKENLLDTAERLFAERGVKETSVRDITRAAGSHLASVNYHFATKHGLIRAVISRRIEPLKKTRFELLDAYEEEAGDNPVPVEKVIYALIAPGIELYLKNPNFLRFAGRMISDPDKELRRIFVSQLDPVFFRVKELLMRALPEIPEAEMMWRIHFTIGAMVHTWTNHSDLELRSGGVCNITNEEEMIDRIVTFCAAGLRAPLHKQSGGV
ncbi:MAG: TetR/AcrR family transcriptional regulator [Deltaproteobacteria bacterium]|nr:TetR/AcrR family transcriptional regulator [Deltaproteobacteria bacterium]